MSTAVLNDTALGLGLPPAGTETFRADSDYGLIQSRINAYHMETLHRGWWFNSEDRKLEPVDGAITVDPEVLRVYVLRHQNYSPSVSITGQFEVDGTTPRPLYNREDKSAEFSAGFTVDQVEYLPIIDCPPEYQRYLVARTVNALANFFGVPVNNDTELEAWAALLRANADHAETHNTIEGNPYNYRISRRR